MNIRTRGRRLTARLAKLEQTLTGRPKTMHYIFYDDEGAYEVLTSRPGKGTETSYVRDPPEDEQGDTFSRDETQENLLPEDDPLTFGDGAA